MDEQRCSTLILSLSHWPEQSFNHKKSQMSPLSAKILDQCGIIVEEIMPQSFDHYVHAKYLTGNEYEQLLEQFHQFELRRKKKVAMLKKLRVEKNHIDLQQQRGHQMLKSSNWMKSTKSTKGTNPNSKSKEKQKNKGYPPNIRQKNKSMSKKTKEKARLLESRNDYFGQYRKTSTSKSIESKKSQKKKSTGSNKIENKKNIAYTPLDQYYDATRTLKNTKSSSKAHKPFNLQLQMLNQMQKCMRQLNQVEKRQAKQIQFGEKLEEKQKKRLKKIHLIQKQQMKLKMREIRNRLNKCSHFLRGISMAQSH